MAKPAVYELPVSIFAIPLLDVCVPLMIPAGARGGHVCRQDSLGCGADDGEAGLRQRFILAGGAGRRGKGPGAASGERRRVFLGCRHRNKDTVLCLDDAICDRLGAQFYFCVRCLYRECCVPGRASFRAWPALSS